MKKNLLKSLTCLLLVAMVAACSTESMTEDNIDLSATEPERQNRSTAWDGVIGVDDNGVIEITANKTELIADLEDALAKQDIRTTLTSLKIEKKTATNDPLDTGYLLIGSNGTDTSIGVVLTRTAPGLVVKLDDGFANPKTTTCRGCATGCNLEYLNIDGKKVAYCNVNGCGPDCVKLETEIR